VHGSAGSFVIYKVDVVRWLPTAEYASSASRDGVGRGGLFIGPSRVCRSGSHKRVSVSLLFEKKLRSTGTGLIIPPLSRHVDVTSVYDFFALV
jgi:hypothetical protein